MGLQWSKVCCCGFCNRWWLAAASYLVCLVMGLGRRQSACPEMVCWASASKDVVPSLEAALWSPFTNAWSGAIQVKTQVSTLVDRASASHSSPPSWGKRHGGLVLRQFAVAQLALRFHRRTCECAASGLVRKSAGAGPRGRRRSRNSGSEEHLCVVDCRYSSCGRQSHRLVWSAASGPACVSY